jgi:hypothetical protein
MSGALTFTKGYEFGTNKLGNLFLTAQLTAQANYARLKDGAISFSGTVTRAGTSLLSYISSSIFTPSGIARRTIRVTHDYASALSLVGQVISNRFQLYDGSLDLSGAVTRIVSKLRTVTGAISTAGTYLYSSPRATFVLSGSLAIYGRLTYIDIILRRFTAAVISPVGTLARRLKMIRAKSGTVSFSGSFLRRVNKPKLYAGGLSFAGAVTTGTITGWNYSVDAVLSFAGAVSRLIEKFRTYTGNLTLSGVYSRVIQLWLSITGAITFAGSVIAAYVSADWKRGYLTFSGALSTSFGFNRLAYASELNISGTVTRTLNLNRCYSGQVDHSGQKDKYKDILYFGPPNP